MNVPGITASKTFVDWLGDGRRSLAVSSCDGSCVGVLHASKSGTLGAAFFPLPVAMGLAWDSGRLFVTDKLGWFRFDAIESRDARSPTRLRATSRTIHGTVDLHDIAVDPDGAIQVVATSRNAIARVDADGRLERFYRPPFISSDVAEDRCHMNGMALDEGRPRYVTCVSRSDVIDGWRDRRRDGGVVVDVRSNEVVVSGLSMPHSPRLHAGSLYVANSGTGEVGVVDRDEQRFVPKVFVPGFARGLAFEGDHFVVGLSMPRSQQTFGDLPLTVRLDDVGTDSRCGVHLCETTTGRTIGWLRFEGSIREVFDLAILPFGGPSTFEENGAIDRPAAAGAR